MAKGITEWLKRRVGALQHIPNYVEEIARQWVDLLFGESVLAVVFLVWWALWNPPLKAIFVVGALLAGYYAWLPNHLRLLPAFRIQKVMLERTPTNFANQHRVYVQVMPECLSSTPIENCRAFLLRVWKRDHSKGVWEPTAINQPLELTWSYSDQTTITLEPNLGQRLNIAWIDNMVARLCPATPNPPMHVYSVFSKSYSFKFDVEVVGKDCPPVFIAVVVDNAWVWDGLTVSVAP